MKRIAVAAALVAFSACSKAPGTAPNASAKPAVLFVGDSLTGTNHLPRVFAAIAASLHEPVDVGAHAPPGAVSTARAALGSNAFLEHDLPAKPWDFVVLQEHSVMPALPDDYVDQEITPYVRQFSDLVREKSPKAKLVFFSTWGFKNGDTGNCARVPEVCSYDGMQDRLTAAYVRMARDNSGIVARVGEAWRLVRQTHPEMELYSGDDHHPSPEGTYLAACVIFSTIFHRGCAGADTGGLDGEEAEILQKAADATTSSSPSITSAH